MSNSLSPTPGTWTIDPAATAVTVTVKKFGVITVPATLTVTSGTIEVNDNQVTSVNVAADATSYRSKNDKRNEHVVGPDFLDAQTHPTISFQAGPFAAQAGATKAAGTVEVKGKTSPLELTVTDVSVDGTTGTFTATGNVDRNALGVDKMPGFIIGRNLDLTIAATANLA